MYQLEVVNPVSPQRGEVSAFPYAPRPSNLKDKVIGLMWNGKAHGDDALKRAGDLIKQAEPSVDVRFYSGALPFPDPLRRRRFRRSMSRLAVRLTEGAARRGLSTTWLSWRKREFRPL